MQQTRLRVEIGERLRAARKAAKLTLEEAGREVGRTKSAVLAWETGESDIAVVQLATLCARYGATADQIVFGVGSVAAGKCVGQRLARMFRLQPFADTSF